MALNALMNGYLWTSAKHCITLILIAPVFLCLNLSAQDDQISAINISTVIPTASSYTQTVPSNASNGLTPAISTFPTTLSSFSGLDLNASKTAAVVSDNQLTRAEGSGSFKAALTTWLKANETDDVTTSTDGSEVIDWQDHWTGNNDFSTTTGNGPTFRNNDTDNINFNPVIAFNRAGLTRLNTPSNRDFNQGIFTNKSYNIVFRTPASFTGRQVIFEQGGYVKGINIYLDGSDLKLSTYALIDNGIGSPWNSTATAIEIPVTASTVYLISFELEGDGSGSNNGSARAYLNGDPLSIPADLSNAIGLLYGHGGAIHLGYTEGTRFDDGGSGSGNSFDGDIAEFVYFNEPSSFSASERNKAESYLAVKYGITLTQNPTQTNYVNSVGSVIFNTNLSTGLGGFEDYDANIAGIGRDNESELEQLKSRSIATGSIVTMEASSISSDNTFLIWGNDQGTSDEIVTSEKPSNVLQRIGREWRVSETGETGNVSISFDISGMTFPQTGSTPSSTDFSLLVANSTSNGDFSSARVITGGILASNTITFSNVNLDAGEFITLGTGLDPTAPGGVTGVDLWLKADNGAINTGDGSDVTSWEDRSGNNYNLSDVGTNEYIFRSTSLNYNPTIDNDDGTNRRLASTTSIDLQTVYMVTIPNSPDEFDNPFSENGADDEGIRANATNGWRVSGNANDLAVDPPDNFWFNGASVSSDPSHGDAPNILAVEVSASTTISGGIEVGDSESNRFWHGDIAEIIGYNGTQSGPEREQIESYLAIKYGITLDQTSATDYVDSNGDDIWNGTTNATYNNDIAGIGRDDDSALEQKQSKSVNSGTILTIGNGSIASSNATNSNPFSIDRIWLAWGNDGATTGVFTSTDVDATSTNNDDDTPLTVTERINRKWRVQKTGAINDVQVAFDLTGLSLSTDPTQFTLLINDNEDFDDASIISGGTFNGNLITFSNVNFTSGDYFSLGTARSISFGPGGKITDLTTWLKANDASSVTSSSDGGSVTLWEDALSGSYNFSTSTASPSYNDNDGKNMNFNPNIEFTSSGTTGLTTPNNNDYNEVAADPFVRKGIQLAFRTSSDITTRQVLYEQGGTARGINIYIRDGQLHISAWNRAERAPLGDWNNTGDVNSISTSIETNQSYIVTFQMDGDDNSDGNGVANGTVTLYLNGRSVGSFGSVGVLYAHGSLIGLGHVKDGTYFDNGSFGGTGQYFNGEIAEFIYSNDPTSFSATQRNQTESYLAIKYGITLDQSSPQNYTNSSGIVIWNGTTNSTYNNDIAGIGRDDVSILNQPKSKSANSDAMVTMEAIGGITDDDRWLIWGNNGISIEGTIDDGNTDFNESEGINSRLFREWKVKENVDLGTIELTFDISGIDGPTGVNTNNLTQLRLMVDANGVFNSGATYYSPISVNPTAKTAVFSVNLNDGEFFTLGSIEDYALPIELVSFDAQAIDNVVQLNWLTASESDNSFFTIERSNDGFNFETLGYLDGAGNSSSKRTYTFNDRNPAEGINFYRLKQTDFSGDYSYSEVKAINIEMENLNGIWIQSNPVAKGEMMIVNYRFEKQEEILFSMISTSGINLLKEPIIITGDYGTLEFNTSLLPRGLNLIRAVTKSGQKYSLKVVIN